MVSEFSYAVPGAEYIHWYHTFYPKWTVVNLFDAFMSGTKIYDNKQLSETLTTAREHFKLVFGHCLHDTQCLIWSAIACCVNMIETDYIHNRRGLLLVSAMSAQGYSNAFSKNDENEIEDTLTQSWVALHICKHLSPSYYDYLVQDVFVQILEWVLKIPKSMLKRDNISSFCELTLDEMVTKEEKAQFTKEYGILTSVEIEYC